MVNTEKFASRLNKILDYYDLSAAAFADKIDVGRSSISHILSGRNKPSLEFVMKVVKNFPEVELYWLLNGKGKFPSVPETPSAISSETEKKDSSPAYPPMEEKITQPQQNISQTVTTMSGSGKKIQKIVIFYTDGSFDAFEN
ncbi:helix-turn-helix transcriptional regulator [Gramella sp. KN1008]|uniref:helix-turn-helix domain-containing protein n=1 Tax=Gramella sp. KN1008 TaxID=2529298 RepID=UPI00103FE8F2|nr:helix-turn-helix transcriptional regulator [Gramella sp. KN1008]TBW29090.1 helix-turn-helix domain-containing protein [Gramella sp. KN1008]